MASDPATGQCWNLFIRKEGTLTMLSESATLHMLCGMIASGKSTMAAQLGATTGTVLIAEDAWLDALPQMTEGDAPPH